jgi:hypothetical protein
MPGTTNASANALLKLILWNENFANVGDATGLRGSSAAGSIYVALFTADPGASGTAITNEVSTSGTGYARVGVLRNNTTWTITNNVATPASNIVFAELTGGSSTATHWGIVTSASGAGTLLLKGTLSPTITISALKTPRITTASTITLS